MLIQDKDFNFVEFPEEKIPELIDGKFVIALDFDGVITNPHKFKTKYINQALREIGADFTISEEQCSRKVCLGLGIPKEVYEKASIRGYAESQEILLLEKGFAENFKKLRALEKIIIIILTSRHDYMIKHLQKYLSYYKIRVDGIIHTKGGSKAEPLRIINAKIFVEDDVYKLEKMLKEDSRLFEKYLLVLYRNISNRIEKSPNKNIMEIDNWNDLFKVISTKYTEFTKKK